MNRFRNSSLAKRLKETSDQNEGSAVEFTVHAPDLTHLSQLEAGDGLGCAVTGYRMLLGALGEPIPGQDEARKALDAKGHIPGGGTRMAVVSTPAAKALGIENAINLKELKLNPNILPQDERNALSHVDWLELLSIALEKGYIAMAALPMKVFHKDSTSDINHAAVIYGAKYNNGKITFLIHDPLYIENKEIDDEMLATNAPDDPTIILTSNKHIQKSRKTRILTNTAVDQEKSSDAPEKETIIISKPQQPQIGDNDILRNIRNWLKGK